MKRRLVAFLLSVVCQPLGFLYAGRPWLALAVGIGASFCLSATFVGYAFGAVPVVALAPGLLACILVPWLVPFGAAALPPRVGHPCQRRLIYLLGAVAYNGLAFSVIQVTQSFVVESRMVPAVSMAPNILAWDFVLVKKLGATLAPGAVIVFRHPTEPDEVYVKRLIATGGQTVEVRSGSVRIDGVEVQREAWGELEDLVDGECQSRGRRRAWRETLGGHAYTTYEGWFYERQMIDYRPVTVPADMLFVMGDNRDDSSDSRVWGFVPEENVMGVVEDRWLSFDLCSGEWRGDRVGPVP